jgi:hypothetical protein
MTRKQIKRWKRAAHLARIAMGKRKVWGEDKTELANDDPLAWWCLAEAIYYLK